MADPTKLQILVDLRRAARLSQERVAELFGLAPEQGRKTIGNWEMGSHPPDKSRRIRFIRYLWDDLGLRQDPARFDLVWSTLAREWHWETISDEEWKNFTLSPRLATSPYKGLECFDVQDAELFFGREHLTAELVAHLRKDNFLAVVGASGSGKSSLVRAGLVPALRHMSALADGGQPPAGSSQWPIHILTPTAHPLAALATSLTSVGQPIIAREALLAELAADPRALGRFVNRRFAHEAHADPAASRLLLIVDQFEELFTLCRDKSEQYAFVANLLTAATGQTLVVLTLRADFYLHCSEFAELRSVLERYQRYIGPMNPEELQRAIEQPARRNGWQLEAGLVDLLLEDIANEPGALPLLSYAITETWRRRHGRTLTLAGYIAAGRVQGAIAQSAETVLRQQLTPDQQAIARTIFLRLTELGDGTQDTRRRVELGELVSTPHEQPAVEAVLQTLVAARLVTTTQHVAEVAHEALIREWPTLREWLTEDREALRIHRRLTQAAQEWRKAGEEKGLLYRGLPLQQALAWAEQHPATLNHMEERFLHASSIDAATILHEQERARAMEVRAGVRQRQLLGALIILTLVVILALWAERSAQQQQVARLQVESLSRQIRSDELAKTALLVSDRQADLGLLLAIEALSLPQSHDGFRPVAAEQSLRTILARSGGFALRGHIGRVVDSKFVLGGEWVATAGIDKTVRLWHMGDLTTPPVVLRGHTDRITVMAVHPNGRWLATGSFDQTVRLWNLAEPETPPVIFEGHPRDFADLAFSPDGRWLATISQDKTARLWDLLDSTHKPINLPRHSDPVEKIAFHPKGRWLATASHAGVARLWDLADPAYSSTVLPGQAKNIGELRFSPEGHWLVATSSDGTARLWVIATPTADPILLTGYNASVLSAAFSPDEHWLVTTSALKSIFLWDLTAPDFSTHPILLNGHEDSIRDAAFSPLGHTLATVSDDQTVRLWDLDHPQIDPLVLLGHTDKVRSVAFSDDGHWLVTSSDDSTARLWDLTSLQGEPLALRAHEDIITCAAFSPDGHWLTSASQDGIILLWNMERTETPPQAITTGGSAILRLVFSPDGHWLAAADADHSLRIWDFPHLASPPIALTGHTADLTALLFSPDNRWIASASADQTVRIWDMQAPASPPRLLTDKHGPVSVLAFSPEGHWLATAGDETSTQLWDLRLSTPEPLLLAQAHAASNVVFQPDGKRLATADREGRILLWNMDDLTAPLELRGHTGSLEALSVSPDGRWLAAGSADTTATVWDLNTPLTSPMILRGHLARVSAVVFNPLGSSGANQLATASDDYSVRLWTLDQPQLDPIVLAKPLQASVSALLFHPGGRLLATLSNDRTILLWTLPIETLIDHACHSAGRNLTQAEWHQYLADEPYHATCPAWAVE